MNLKERIFDYLKEHSHSTIQDVSKALGVDDMSVLREINIMSKKGYVFMNTPVPLSDFNRNSNYYSVSKTEFNIKDFQ